MGASICAASVDDREDERECDSGELDGLILRSATPMILVCHKTPRRCCSWSAAQRSKSPDMGSLRVHEPSSSLLGEM